MASWFVSSDDAGAVRAGVICRKDKPEHRHKSVSIRGIYKEAKKVRLPKHGVCTMYGGSKGRRRYLTLKCGDNGPPVLLQDGTVSINPDRARQTSKCIVRADRSVGVALLLVEEDVLVVLEQPLNGFLLRRNILHLALDFHGPHYRGREDHRQVQGRHLLNISHIALKKIHDYPPNSRLRAESHETNGRPKTGGCRNEHGVSP